MTQLSDYLLLFPPHTREKPRFMALAEAVLSQATDLITLVTELFPAARLPETAEGAQLDALGELLGVPRPAEASDEAYRFLLRAKIAVRHWDGTNETLPQVLEAAFPGLNVRLTDNQDGTVSLSLSGTPPLPLAGILPVPAGIRLLE